MSLCRGRDAPQWHRPFDPSPTWASSWRSAKGKLSSASRCSGHAELTASTPEPRGSISSMQSRRMSETIIRRHPASGLHTSPHLCLGDAPVLRPIRAGVRLRGV
eukprot:s4650_g5.t3